MSFDDGAHQSSMMILSHCQSAFSKLYISDLEAKGFIHNNYKEVLKKMRNENEKKTAELKHLTHQMRPHLIIFFSVPLLDQKGCKPLILFGLI